MIQIWSEAEDDTQGIRQKKGGARLSITIAPHRFPRLFYVSVDMFPIKTQSTETYMEYGVHVY